MGVKGKIHSWVSAFLSNRTQIVLVKGKKSRPVLVISGVPQGTVLGPLLFIIFINDITKVIKHCQIKIFADDSKLSHIIKSFEDNHALQEDLDAVMKWASDNNMELNQDKFEILHHGSDRTLDGTYILPNGKSIQTESHTIRDLGIHINDTLSWSDHYNLMVTEAKKYAGWILRTFSTRSQHAILLLYGSLVRMRLEYSCPLWMPFTKKDIMSIESVQRSVTSKIQEVSGLNYWERLEKLGLYSLQRRRERYCIIHVWKILWKFAPNDIEMAFHDNLRLGPVAEIPKLKAKRQHTNTLRNQSFSCHGPRLFNILPKELKLLDTLPSFKLQLDKFLKLIPDTPPTPGYVAANSNSLIDWASCGSHRGYTNNGVATSSALVMT